MRDRRRMNTKPFLLFLRSCEEVTKDNIGMGKVGEWDYLCIDRTVYLLLAKMNPSIYSL